MIISYIALSIWILFAFIVLLINFGSLVSGNIGAFGLVSMVINGLIMYFGIMEIIQLQNCK